MDMLDESVLYHAGLFLYMFPSSCVWRDTLTPPQEFSLAQSGGF